MGHRDAVSSAGARYEIPVYKRVQWPAPRWAIFYNCFMPTRRGRVMKVSRSRRGPVATMLNRPESKRNKENMQLVEQIRDIHGQSRQTYGSPRIYVDATRLNLKAWQSHAVKIVLLG